MPKKTARTLSKGDWGQYKYLLDSAEKAYKLGFPEKDRLASEREVNLFKLIVEGQGNNVVVNTRMVQALTEPQGTLEEMSRPGSQGPVIEVEPSMPSLETPLNEQGRGRGTKKKEQAE